MANKVNGLGYADDILLLAYSDDIKEVIKYVSSLTLEQVEGAKMVMADRDQSNEAVIMAMAVLQGLHATYKAGDSSVDILEHTLLLASQDTDSYLIEYIKSLPQVDRGAALILCNSTKGDTEIEKSTILKAWTFLQGVHEIDSELNLPPLADGLKDFELAAGISETVIVKFKTCDEPSIGRYLHTQGKWQINGMSGGVCCDEVEEWWFLPIKGSGMTPVRAG